MKLVQKCLAHDIQEIQKEIDVFSRMEELGLTTIDILRMADTVNNVRKTCSATYFETDKMSKGAMPTPNTRTTYQWSQDPDLARRQSEFVQDDENELVKILQFLLDKHHYTTQMDKFVTYGLPEWLCAEYTGALGILTKREMKKALALHRVCLPILAKDPDDLVRAAVAYVGYESEKMYQDPSHFVRAACAVRGFYTDVLYQDEEPFVRENVALSGNHLKELVKDPDPSVRRAVAANGKYLKILINDPSPRVREEVAQQGFGLNTLVQDENAQVRICAANKQIEKAVNRACKSFLNSQDICVRKSLALKGYLLDALSQDENDDVRAMVAQHNFALERLISDPSEKVRIAVASTGYGAEQLSSDPSENVRRCLALNGYNPLIMCQDSSPKVRAELALYGFELAFLCDDENEAVAEIARETKKGHFKRAKFIHCNLLSAFDGQDDRILPENIQDTLTDMLTKEN